MSYNKWVSGFYALPILALSLRPSHHSHPCTSLMGKPLHRILVAIYSFSLYFNFLRQAREQGGLKIDRTSNSVCAAASWMLEIQHRMLAAGHSACLLLGGWNYKCLLAVWLSFKNLGLVCARPQVQFPAPSILPNSPLAQCNGISERERVLPEEQAVECLLSTESTKLTTRHMTAHVITAAEMPVQW